MFPSGAAISEGATPTTEPNESTDNGCPTEGEPATGQEHHIISRRVAAAIADHPTLKGLYQPRDPRFVARAKDRESHCGYQGWHREIDAEIIKWLEDNPSATTSQFESFLRWRNDQPDPVARFPGGF